MLSTIKSIALNGLDGYVIKVQVDISPGLPSWEMVGLPDASVRESKERVRTAIKNSGFDTLSKKIVINLAPANIKKEGAFLDLPIAIGILTSMGLIEENKFKETAFIGELSLDGKINGVDGILPMCIEAKKIGVEKLIIPKENLKEASIVKGINIKGANNLKEVVSYLNGCGNLENILEDVMKIKYEDPISNLDFSEIKGQENVKRAIEISACGGHNVLLVRFASDVAKQ